MTGNRIIIGFITIAFFFIVFHSALSIPFAFQNDLGFFTYDNHSGWLDWPEGKYLIPMGRILNAFLANLHFSFISDISDFSVGRAISVLTIGLMAAVFGIWLEQLGLDLFVAMAVSAGVFLLPTIQLAVVWQTQFVSAILPLPLVFAAAVPLHRQMKKRTWTLVGQVLSFILLIIILFIYPPTAALILVPRLAAVLFSSAEWKDERRLVIRDVILFLAACSAYYALQKFVVLPLTSSLFQEGLAFDALSHRFELTVNLAHNLEELMSRGWLIVVNLWNISAQPWVGIAVISVIVTGGLTSFFWNATRTSGTWPEIRIGIEKVFMAVLLLVAGNTPNLAAPVPYVTYRTIYCFATMVALLFFWGLIRISCVLGENQLVVRRSAFAMLTVAIAVAAQTNTLNVALNTYLEIDVHRVTTMPDYFFWKKMEVGSAHGVIGFDNDTPEFGVDPYLNLLGRNLPLDFGLYLKGNEVRAMIARESEIISRESMEKTNRIFQSQGESLQRQINELKAQIIAVEKYNKPSSLPLEVLYARLQKTEELLAPLKNTGQ